MAADEILASEERLCCICLDAFAEQVTLPCTHDFCWKCITQYWDNTDRYRCPLCNEYFSTRPRLQINTVTSEPTDPLRNSAQQTASSCSSEQASAGEVRCDICTKAAQKSCMVCLSSYCRTHLRFHQSFAGLRRHTLTHPEEGLEDRMSKKYQKATERFRVSAVRSKLMRSCKRFSQKTSPDK